MAAQTDFPLIFIELKAILQPYAAGLNLKHDTGNTYYLDGPYSEKWKRQLFFGSAQIKKNYVSSVIKTGQAVEPARLLGLTRSAIAGLLEKQVSKRVTTPCNLN